MNVLQSLFYGFVAGLTEFLPISSQGHQSLLRILFGADFVEPIRDILIHIAMLAAVLFTCGAYIDRLRRSPVNSKKALSRADRRTGNDLRVIKTAAIALIVLLFANIVTAGLRSDLGFLALFFAINGVIVYLPQHLTRSNKDSTQISALDAFMLGVSGALSVFSGISRVGASLSYATARGADPQKAYMWVLILSIPSLIVLLICDIVGIFITGFGNVTFIVFLGYLLSAFTAFCGAFLSIRLMRWIVNHFQWNAFAFYSWGAAMLCFLLHLFV